MDSTTAFVISALPCTSTFIQNQCRSQRVANARSYRAASKWTINCRPLDSTKGTRSKSLAPLHMTSSSTSVAFHPVGTPRKTTRAAVLISGGGRSLENILQKIDSGSLRNVQVSCVIASKQTAKGREYSEARSIPTFIIRQKDFPSVEKYSAEIDKVLDSHQIDLVVLAGWMHFYLIPPQYLGRVINIHPALIPSFCGHGFYGHKVHEAVIEYGAKVSGCTVHFADNEYDHGAIILQRTVPVHWNDTPDVLAARVFEEEKIALVEAIQLIADNRLLLDGRCVRILDE